MNQRKHYCSSCSQSKISVSASPLYQTPYESLSWDEKARLARIKSSFWDGSIDPPVSNAQQQVFQSKAVQRFLPYYVDNGGSTRNADVGNFFY